MTVVHGFYFFHGRFGAGPVINPVPVSVQRRQVLAHRSPLVPIPFVRRAPAAAEGAAAGAASGFRRVVG